ncbi:MAG: type II toxin-antitoxin system HicA family toxin [Candidatus Delongbacteria bacterium]|nr:type II toxin-antitoxin system HicA family toxin [Candidatus Delongbacteria bacterium]
MKSISGKKLCIILETKGWILKRVNGSHYIYVKNDSPYRISVPVHSNEDLKIGLLENFMELANIKIEEL